MHDLLTQRILVFFQLNVTSPDLVIKEAERALDPSKWPRNLRFGTRMALSTNRMGVYLHDMVKQNHKPTSHKFILCPCHGSEIPS